MVQQKQCFTELHAGLGNQMFELATAYAHSKRNGYSLTIGENVRSSRGSYWDTILHKWKHMIGPMQRRSPSGPRPVVWIERGFRYKPIPAPMQVLSGYFQSSKYFAEYANEIRDLFDLPDELKQTVRAKYADLLTMVNANSDEVTMVHIRRGDYVGLSSHGILTTDYYERATKNRTNLVVFSDDIAWCRSLPFLANARFVDEPVDYIALYLMSQFGSFILSNSTFSWWAAWLSRSQNKSVLVPDRWFGPTGPQDYQDIYEPEWTKLSVDL